MTSRAVLRGAFGLAFVLAVVLGCASRDGQQTQADDPAGAGSAETIPGAGSGGQSGAESGSGVQGTSTTPGTNPSINPMGSSGSASDGQSADGAGPADGAGNGITPGTGGAPGADDNAGSGGTPDDGSADDGAAPAGQGGAEGSMDLPTDGQGSPGESEASSPRRRVLLTQGWRFTKNDPPGTSGLGYASARSWVLPTGNDFVSDPGRRAQRPDGNLGDDVSYVAKDFDDSAWQSVDLPHDYAIEGPFTDSISSSMRRLPSIGVAWYRKRVTISAEDAGKSVFLELDGAMSYSMVWVNGQFVGGWPYGYASYRVDLTPHLEAGAENVIAVRLDNPVPQGANWDQGSSRWYPGAGIYRNVWLVSTHPVHVSHWGTRVLTPQVSTASASVELRVSVDNDTEEDATLELTTQVFELDAASQRVGDAVAFLEPATLVVPARSRASADSAGSIPNPKRWGTPPEQQPNRYVAVTSVSDATGVVVDVYETRFGVRSTEFDPDQGFILNGERIQIRGVCLHHDLGALGAAFNTRAMQRQLEIMIDMGSNAIRTAHNPPAPEVLELADRMGMLVMDEAFDVWAQGKAELDHHVFFDDWHEQDLRALIRRDRNHPSVVMWSIGNEVVEQNDNSAGPALAEKLTRITREEDPTRPTVAGMNSAKPDNPFSGPIDTVGLNYQGTGVRSGPPQYPAYHAAFPDKFIVGTETTSTFSSRGVYTFPVVSGRGQPASGSPGIADGQISSYDLYFADWSYSPDAEFESLERHPYVGGEFVWTGFDYLGEPTPLDSVARSSYFGIVDLAGFPKDRFYLYQAHWRKEHPMAHLLPHWTWPERVGEVTPVHVYTSGDEAELFLNGASLGRKAKAQYEYRLRWDDVRYEPGELAVVAYKDGVEWATDVVTTAGDASKLSLTPDRVNITADGADLSFVTLKVEDAEGRMAPRAMNRIRFEVSGPGEIVATDNGDPTDRTPFQAHERDVFNGMALVIVRALAGQSGEIVVTASSSGLTSATTSVTAD